MLALNALKYTEGLAQLRASQVARASLPFHLQQPLAVFTPPRERVTDNWFLGGSFHVFHIHPPFLPHGPAAGRCYEPPADPARTRH